MVQGYTNKASWGFPKGKQEVLETGMQCALREVNMLLSCKKTGRTESRTNLTGLLF